MIPLLSSLLLIILALSGGVWPASADGGSCWHTELVDDTVAVVGPSLALDAQEQPHIAYNDRTSTASWPIKYARHEGATWHIETVHNSSRYSSFASLALDASSTPHITWVDYWTFRAKYAYYAGSAWQVQTIDDNGGATWPKWTSIEIGSDGHIHISYNDDTDDTVGYHLHDGNAWQPRQTVDDLEGDMSVDMALDSQDHPHIAYSITPYSSVLRHAWHDGTAWQVETVCSNCDVGPVSIAVDASGNPRILRQNREQGTLEYWSKDGGSWSMETITTDAAYDVVCLQLDSLDRPHISYTAVEDGSSYYATYGYQSSGVWQMQTVAPGGSGSLVLDAGDQPHIAYRGADEHLWYGYAKQPVDAVQDLISDIEVLNLPTGLETSLVAKLEAAITSLDRGRENAAINQLNAFINLVEAQSGKKLTDEQAQQLVTDAQGIIGSI